MSSEIATVTKTMLLRKNIVTLS